MYDSYKGLNLGFNNSHPTKKSITHSKGTTYMTISPPRNCPNCGAMLPAQAAFCGICGHSLKATALLPASHPTAQNQPASAMSPTGLLPATHLLKQRYHILKQIGKGGFGAVYRAIDTHIGNRVVAVKEMSQSGLGPQEIASATE